MTDDPEVEPTDLPDHSGVQQRAESVLLDLLSERLGVTLQPGRIDLPDAART